MSNTYEFYIEKYNNIQRHIYDFINKYTLSSDEQAEVIKKFSLGTNFCYIESVQEYNSDLLIRGYVKVDFREMEYSSRNIKGKFVEKGNYLKEVTIQIPKN